MRRAACEVGGRSTAVRLPRPPPCSLSFLRDPIRSPRTLPLKERIVDRARRADRDAARSSRTWRSRLRNWIRDACGPMQDWSTDCWRFALSTRLSRSSKRSSLAARALVLGRTAAARTYRTSTSDPGKRGVSSSTADPRLLRAVIENLMAKPRGKSRSSIPATIEFGVAIIRAARDLVRDYGPARSLTPTRCFRAFQALTRGGVRGDRHRAGHRRADPASAWREGSGRKGVEKWATSLRHGGPLPCGGQSALACPPSVIQQTRAPVPPLIHPS